MILSVRACKNLGPGGIHQDKRTALGISWKFFFSLKVQLEERGRIVSSISIQLVTILRIAECLQRLLNGLRTDMFFEETRCDDSYG